MNYKYRVTLAGIKGFFRVYHINGSNSLYTFHKQLRSDLEFPLDQPILFKALDDKGDVVARWAFVDLGAGTVDTVKISDTIKKGVTSFVYFYDITSKKSVIITLEEEIGADVLVPTLMESKGPVPVDFENGYVAFEDIPADRRPGGYLTKKDRPAEGDEEDEEDFDEEDEEDEDDEDKEEEDIIYDENEQ